MLISRFRLSCLPGLPCLARSCGLAGLPTPLSRHNDSRNELSLYSPPLCAGNEGSTPNSHASANVSCASSFRLLEPLRPALESCLPVPSGAIVPTIALKNGITPTTAAISLKNSHVFSPFGFHPPGQLRGRSGKRFLIEPPRHFTGGFSRSSATRFASG